jgi:hypothetical protein
VYWAFETLYLATLVKNIKQLIKTTHLSELSCQTQVDTQIFHLLGIGEGSFILQLVLVTSEEPIGSIAKSHSLMHHIKELEPTAGDSGFQVNGIQRRVLLIHTDHFNHILVQDLNPSEE